MKKLMLIIIALSTFCFALECPGFDNFQTVNPSNYWPKDGWRTATPERQGIDSRELVKIFDFVKANDVQIHSLLLVRNGYVVLDVYFYPFSKAVVHDLASVTKSITSTLIGIAIDKGYIKSVKQPVLEFFPGRTFANMDERKKRMTVEHLLTMTSGFCRNFEDGEAQLELQRLSDDWVQFILDQPLMADPGSEFAYCSCASNLLSAIITRATGMNEETFARKYLLGPLAIHDVRWPSDPLGNSNGWGDVFMHPVDMAKIGYLFLNEGRWGGKQIVSKEWVKEATRQHVTVSSNEGYGYKWWMPLEFPGLYEARGRGGQRICIWPEKNIVAVFTGSGFEPGDIGSILVSAMKSDQPLPENKEGDKFLQDKIAEAAQAPSPKPMRPLPPMVRQISGKTFVFDPNHQGLKSLSLIFKEGKEAIIRITFSDPLNRQPRNTRESLIGLDDVYRISNTSRFNLPLAAKGSWATDQDFECIYNEAANNHIYRMRIHFEGDRASMRMVENSGLLDVTLTAKIQK